MLVAAILVVFPFAMSYAAMSDMMSMTIANRISILLVGAFLVIAPLTGMPLIQIGWHVAALAIVLSVCFALFAAGAMGGGDAKLMASTALWFGLDMNLISYLLVASALGGVLTLAILRFRSSNVTVYAGKVDFLLRIADPKEKIPYGIALGIAGLLIYPETPLMIWAMNQLTMG
ncbi:MAG: prepilin peptidase [Rhizobiaceae bacterium]